MHNRRICYGKRAKPDREWVEKNAPPRAKGHKAPPLPRGISKRKGA